MTFAHYLVIFAVLVGAAIATLGGLAMRHERQDAHIEIKQPPTLSRPCAANEEIRGKQARVAAMLVGNREELKHVRDG